MTRAVRWAWPLGVYALSRGFTLLLVLTTARERQVALPGLPGLWPGGRSPVPPSYWDVMASWDGQYYWSIATQGYASTAYSPAGEPVQTTLAFFPAYPMLVRGVIALTGLSFPVAASVTSSVLGAAAVVVVFELVRHRLGIATARGAVVLLCCFISAPILQAAYTESLALLLVASGLSLLARRRYAALLPVLVLLGLTRNVVLAMVPVILVHGWHLRRRGELDARTTGLLAGAAVTAIVSAGAWPLLAAVVTGEPRAYLDTVTAWDGYTGSIVRPPLVVAVLDSGPAAVLLCAAVAATLVVALARRSARDWGPELWGWAVSYLTYIVLTVGATPSWMRYLLLAFPLALLVAHGRPGRARVVAVTVAAGVGLACQVVWVTQYLVYAGPHGGLGYP